MIDRCRYEVYGKRVSVMPHGVVEFLAPVYVLLALPLAAYGAGHSALALGSLHWLAACAGIVILTIVGVLSIEGRSRSIADDIEIVSEVWE